MGDRYFLTVTCPECNEAHYDVYYAPTCGCSQLECTCGEVIDLEEYTGISYEDASNLKEIEEMVKRVSEKYEKGEK